MFLRITKYIVVQYIIIVKQNGLFRDIFFPPNWPAQSSKYKSIVFCRIPTGALIISMHSLTGESPRERRRRERREIYEIKLAEWWVTSYYCHKDGRLGMPSFIWGIFFFGLVNHQEGTAWPDRWVDRRPERGLTSRGDGTWLEEDPGAPQFTAEWCSAGCRQPMTVTEVTDTKSGISRNPENLVRYWPWPPNVMKSGGTETVFIIQVEKTNICF